MQLLFILFAAIALPTFVGCLILGIDWLMWKLWLFVAPGLGLSAAIGFWQFAGLMLLVAFIGNLLFRKRNRND